MNRHVVRFDWAIKRLLRNKADYVVVEGFLTVVLGRPIKIKSILESESNQEEENSKFNRVDLLAEDEDGELIIFEIQNNHEIDYFQRIVFGTSKTLTEYIKKKDEYRKVRKIYSINIVYFAIGQGNDYVYHGTTNFIGLHDNKVLGLTKRQQEVFGCASVADIFPEYYLLRVNEFDDVAKTPLDEWINYLKTNEIPDDATAPGLPEAREVLLYDNLPAEERRRYDREMDNLRFENSVAWTYRIEGEAIGMEKGMEKGEAIGMEKGMQKGMEKGEAIGMEKGMEKGRVDERVAIAKKMLAMGLKSDQIATATSLSVDEIAAL